MLSISPPFDAEIFVVTVIEFDIGMIFPSLSVTLPEYEKLFAPFPSIPSVVM